MPEIVGSEHAELCEALSVLGKPRGPSFLETGVEDVSVTAFDEAGANG